MKIQLRWPFGGIRTISKDSQFNHKWILKAPGWHMIVNLVNSVQPMNSPLDIADILKFNWGAKHEKRNNN